MTDPLFNNISYSDLGGLSLESEQQQQSEFLEIMRSEQHAHHQLIESGNGGSHLCGSHGGHVMLFENYVCGDDNHTTTTATAAAATTTTATTIWDSSSSNMGLHVSSGDKFVSDACVPYFSPSDTEESMFNITTTEDQKKSNNLRKEDNGSDNNNKEKGTRLSPCESGRGSSILSEAMLSPPCSSSSSEGDIDVDMADFQELFPELADFSEQDKLKLRISTITNGCGTTVLAGGDSQRIGERCTFSDDAEAKSGAGSLSNRPTINVSRVVPKKEGYSTINILESRNNSAAENQHSYAYLNEQRSHCSGKIPKYAEYEPENGFAVCGPMSKNAILARENRRKKKEYVTTLESEVAKLNRQKNDVINDLKRAHTNIDSLKEEVSYLKSVIANQSTISALLKNIPNASGVNFKQLSSENNREVKPAKRPRVDHDYVSTTTTSSPGVCLHVAEGSVSIEFCKQCNVNSTQLA